MSENAVPQEEGAKTLDFTGVKVIGLGGGGITSINGDVTPAQLLIGGTQIAVVDGGGGSHTLNVAALATINGDNIPGQVFTSPDLSISITDFPGTGLHTLGLRAIFDVQSTGIVPVHINNGVETTLLTEIMPANPGLWQVFASVQAASVLPGTCMIRARIYNGLAVIGEDIREVTTGVNVNGYACSIFSYLVNYAGGETVTIKILADAAAPGFDVFCTLNVIRIGA